MIDPLNDGISRVEMIDSIVDARMFSEKQSIEK